jgi:FAD/FMN-containing dehydrogenase
MSTTQQTRATSPLPVPAALRDLIVQPGDDGWDEARQAWNLAADQQPAAVARPGTADDVIAIVAWARAGGLRVAAQGTGHAAASLSWLENTLLVRTGRLGEVQIDPELRRARVGAGVIWADVSTAAAEFGLAALAGSASDVGVTGYTLGGGVSWLARRYGLAANSVLAVELVTADGAPRGSRTRDWFAAAVGRVPPLRRGTGRGRTSGWRARLHRRCLRHVRRGHGRHP